MSCPIVQIKPSTEFTTEHPRIPDRNSPYIYVRLQQGVDAVHYPAEQPPIQGLRHGVSNVSGFVHSVGADDGLSPGDHALGGQSLLEFL